MKDKHNITIIGMAGVGKSHIGKELAGKIGYDYIEVDELISKEATTLGINKYLLPDDEFIKLEEKAILSLEHKRNSVIDTGGSVIYSEKSMEILQSISMIIYFKDSIEDIKERFDVRNEPHLVGIENKSFDELFEERSQLYEKYADDTINVSEFKGLVDEVVRIYNQ